MVKELKERVASVEEEMRKALTGWSLGRVVEALMALRGVSLITAMTVVAEIGDMSRFESPRQLMAHLGLVPSHEKPLPMVLKISKTGSALQRDVSAVWALGERKLKQTIPSFWRH